MPVSPLDYLFGLEHFGIKFGLDNITALVRRLGDPQKAFLSVHVAGTNGKGSVAAMVDAILREAGHRSARYTSPHLVDLRERFVVDGQPVAAPALDAAIERVRAAVVSLQQEGTLEVHPTFFEVTTAVAFEMFREMTVEIAVCEVGLGGRLDATNVLSPTVAAITSIALDHQQYLGNTIAEIASEKAGIIKAGVPVVVGGVPADAAAVIDRIARERSAPVVWASEETTIEPVDLRSGRVRARTRLRDYGEFSLALSGRHQLGNASVAICVAELLDTAGIHVSRDAVVHGLEQVRWPGRLQRISCAGGREALLDAAHNPAGAEALASYLGELVDRWPLVFAVMRDKDAEGILRILAPTVSSVIATRASNPRSADAAAIAAAARRVAPRLNVTVAPTPAEAIADAWRQSPRIVIAGSIFLLGDVIQVVGAA